jgi:broad specificity phosphatase PhoE
MKLLLVRHGESAANAEGRLQGQFDSPLSDRGRVQAQAVAHRLGRELREPAAIYTSDLSRASETAEIISEQLELPVVLDPRLREYDFGVLNGIIWRETESLYPEVWRSFQHGSDPVPIPGEEGRRAFRKRLATALTSIHDRHAQEGWVVVVTHGGALAAIMADLLGLEPGWPRPFWFDNASLSIVEYHSRGPVISRLNDVCHLKNEHGWRPPTPHA